MKICFASHNENKVKEMREMLPGNISLIGLSELNVTEDIPETGITLEENALIKAKFIHDRFNIPVFADDSGLCVEALNGAPGVYSARYAGPEKDDEKNMNLLLKNLAGAEDRSAQFQTVIAFIDDHGNSHLFEGTIHGEIIREKRGTNGFGYDPIFMPQGYDLTFAQLSAKEKNQISHRAQAVKKFLAYLHKTYA